MLYKYITLWNVCQAFFEKNIEYFKKVLDFSKETCYNTTCSDCLCDGIGRRAGLKIQW